MAGPRTDKQDAWQGLAEVLSIHQQVCVALRASRFLETPKPLLDDTWHSYNLLRTSGRLDAQQVKIIKHLIKAVICTERYVFNLGGVEVDPLPEGTDAQQSPNEAVSGSSADQSPANPEGSKTDER